MLNPYLLEAKKFIKLSCLNDYEAFGIQREKRLELVRKYSWAIPDEDAINEIVKYSPIVEAGAGTGYWAWLISQKGGDIIALDKFPPATSYNYYNHNYQHFPVYYGDEESIKDYQDRTLMLCWCPYNNDMGYNHIRNYNGNHLILIGEEEGGCCGNDEMFSLIEERFYLITNISIPQWDGIHDILKIYKRK